MPECVLDAYFEQMPRLRAERIIDAARAAAGPYQKQGWWDALRDQAYGAVRQATAAAGAGARLAFNGVPVGVRELKSRLNQALGGGYSE